MSVNSAKAVSWWWNWLFQPIHKQTRQLPLGHKTLAPQQALLQYLQIWMRPNFRRRMLPWAYHTMESKPQLYKATIQTGPNWITKVDWLWYVMPCGNPHWFFFCFVSERCCLLLVSAYCKIDYLCINPLFILMYWNGSTVKSTCVMLSRKITCKMH